MARAADRTPSAGPALRGKPARAFQSRPGPPLIIVVALLAVGLLVALTLWATAGSDGDDATDTTPSAPGATAVAPVSAAGIATVVAYDPESRDGEENNAQAPGLATGGSWSTSCYSNQYLGKSGVGVVATLDQAAAGTLSFGVDSSRYQIDVFATAGDTIPAEIGDEAWGVPLNGDDAIYREEPARILQTVATPARHLLILFREVGPDSGCSGQNPYRSTLSDVTFGP